MLSISSPQQSFTQTLNPSWIDGDPMDSMRGVKNYIYSENSDSSKKKTTNAAQGKWESYVPELPVFRNRLSMSNRGDMEKNQKQGPYCQPKNL
jgi:hypothetical protein